MRGEHSPKEDMGSDQHAELVMRRMPPVEPLDVGIMVTSGRALSKFPHGIADLDGKSIAALKTEHAATIRIIAGKKSTAKLKEKSAEASLTAELEEGASDEEAHSPGTTHS